MARPFRGVEAAKRGKILVEDAWWRRGAFPSFEQPIKTVPPMPGGGGGGAGKCSIY